MIHLKVKIPVPYLDECDKLLISHHVKVLPTLEESAESPEADGAVDKVPFSPVDLEAGQGTPDSIDEGRIQSLREEALSKVHLMIHIPKNPFCQGCLRAKLNAKQARRRHIKSDAKAFGDIVTAGHLIARDADGGGIDNEKVAILIKDNFSSWMMLSPTGGKSADEAAQSVADFQGNKEKESIKLVYTDNAPELIAAISRFKLKHDTGTPYHSITNSIAERSIRTVTGGPYTA